MSAVPVIDRSKSIDVLRTPYNTWSALEVLKYFQSRSNIKYFAVANEAEVIREKVDNILVNEFNFNEETYEFRNAINWLVNPSTDMEWSIMLHKFYYAVGLGIAYQDTGDSRYAKKWVALTTSWINTVPVSFLSADVTGRRIQNWVFAHYYFVTECNSGAITAEFYRDFLTSIHEQVAYLCVHLTPARNHRTLELYTIFLVAVVFPEFADANKWLRFSIDELLKNIQSDVLDDGVHCELSTDYHHIVLRNFLAVRRLAAMNNIDLPKEIDDGIKRALEFSIYIHKPDGTIPSLSDGDTGSFLELLEQGYMLYGYDALLYVASQGKQGHAPKQRSKAFPTGGYYILRSGWGEPLGSYQDERYLVFDCGDLGAGNHGHLDLLSFEMAAYGQSLIVDPGRFTYDESGEENWRVKFRGTGYHNTVLVDDRNQTRYEFHKEKFKIKGAPPGYGLKAFVSRPGFDYLHGIALSHEYPVVHERKILFVNGEYWIIYDVLRAEESHHYDQLFHLSTSAHNKVSIHCDQHCFSVDAPNLILLHNAYGATSVSIEDGFVSPTYGVKQEAPVVKFTQRGAECCFYTVLYPYKNERPTLSVSSIPIFKNQQSSSPVSASCLMIKLQVDGLVYRDMVFVANEHGEFEAGQRILNTPVFFQREDEHGRVLNQFDYAKVSDYER